MIKASELIGISGMDRPHVPPKISFLLFKTVRKRNRKFPIFFFKSVQFHQRFHEKKFPRSPLLELLMLLLCMLLTPISISTDRHVNLVLGLFLGDANYNFNQLSIYVVTLYAWKMETIDGNNGNICKFFT